MMYPGLASWAKISRPSGTNFVKSWFSHTLESPRQFQPLLQGLGLAVGVSHLAVDFEFFGHENGQLGQIAPPLGPGAARLPDGGISGTPARPPPLVVLPHRIRGGVPAPIKFGGWDRRRRL